MPGFTRTLEVPRTPEATFAYLVDLAAWPSFRGWGPLPGIVSAELEGGGARLEPGSRVRVTNTDGSVHHEIVEELVPGRRFRVRMELGRPARYALARIDEVVDLSPTAAGTRIVRRFDVTPRSWLTAPVAWLVGRVLLPRAVAAHYQTVARDLAAR